MSRKNWAIALGALILAVVVGLALVAVTRGADDVPRTLRGEDDGSVVRMSVGEQVVLHLRGNITTGYAWEVAEADPAVIGQVGDYDYESDSDADGAAGTFTFRFEAVGHGEAEVVLVYRGPGTDADVSGTFSFTVVVG